MRILLAVYDSAVATAAVRRVARLAKALKEAPELEFLQTPLGTRKAFSNAAAQGLSVVELKPQDSKASEELLTLYQRVFNVNLVLKG